MGVLVSLTTAESKRLIGRGLAAHPDVRRALDHGRILISGGSTTGYFVEELLGEPFAIARFPCGVVTEGVLCTTPDDRVPNLMVDGGVVVNPSSGGGQGSSTEELLARLGPGDVCVKGANAIDAEGTLGILLAHPQGGTIMRLLPKVVAQGVRLLVPVGLEKMVPSVREAQRHMLGVRGYRYSFGRGCGYVTLPCGEAFTELSALRLLTGAVAYHVASGGVGDCQGAVTLVVEGTEEQEERAIGLLRSIKGEPAVSGWRMRCSDCTFRCEYRFGREGA